MEREWPPGGQHDHQHRLSSTPHAWQRMLRQFSTDRRTSHANRARGSSTALATPAPFFLHSMMRRSGVPCARATMSCHVGAMGLINIIASPPVWDDPITWGGVSTAHVHQHPEGCLVQRCGRRLGGPARKQTGLPRTATPFGFDLNVHGAALVMVAGHEVNCRHIASEGDRMGSTLVQFGHDKIFTCACPLLIACSTRCGVCRH